MRLRINVICKRKLRDEYYTFTELSLYRKQNIRIIVIHIQIPEIQKRIKTEIRYTEMLCTWKLIAMNPII